MKEKISNNIQIKNKRATFDYELLDTFTAGIVLTGTEIKSIRLDRKSTRLNSSHSSQSRMPSSA